MTNVRPADFLGVNFLGNIHIRMIQEDIYYFVTERSS